MPLFSAGSLKVGYYFVLHCGTSILKKKAELASLLVLGSRTLRSLEMYMYHVSFRLVFMSISLSQAFLVPPPAPPKSNKSGSASPSVPAYATSLWFATLVGVIGGFATILTNSMGPMLKSDLKIPS